MIIWFLEVTISQFVHGILIQELCTKHGPVSLKLLSPFYTKALQRVLAVAVQSDYIYAGYSSMIQLFWLESDNVIAESQSTSSHLKLTF